GDLMATLKDLGLDQDTIVVFSSDNGPSVESYLPQDYKPTFFDSYGPFDGIKRDCWDGGVRVPTILRWSGRVPGGRENAVASSFADWLPTFADAAGVPVPARSDGVSLLPALTGQGQQRAARVYVEYAQNQKTPQFAQPNHRGRQRNQMQAIVVGDKVGVRYDIKGADDDFEIYELADTKQLNNLAKTPGMAEVQAQLKATALRVRRPDPEAKRPYDAAPIPALDVKGEPRPGVAWQAFDGDFPWVPRFDEMSPAIRGVSTRGVAGALPADDRFGLLITGYLNVPADGRYELSVVTGGRAILRVHEATVIDADRGVRPAEGDPTGSIVLKAGPHPFRLYYVPAGKGKAGKPGLELFWSGPGIERQPVPASALTNGGVAEK
ncbi:MAG TPA: sulfatase-like hydrolase/transferase, partial [Humisphaera sp.]